MSVFLPRDDTLSMAVGFLPEDCLGGGSGEMLEILGVERGAWIPLRGTGTSDGIFSNSGERRDRHRVARWRLSPLPWAEDGSCVVAPVSLVERVAVEWPRLGSTSVSNEGGNRAGA